MQKFFSLLAAAVATFAVALTLGLYGNAHARASDHQDSPLTVSRPGADITDVFVFPAADPNKVVLAMDVWPLIPSGLGASTFFDPGVMYQFKIAHGQVPVEDQVIQFKANAAGVNQQIQMFGPARPALTGTSATFVKPFGAIPYNKVTDLGGGVTVFAGPREDPFYFDLAQFFRIIPDRNWANQPNAPANTATCFRKDAKDFLAGYNVLSLVVEMPRSMLADQDGHLERINVWATTSLRTTDPDVARDAPLASLSTMLQNFNSKIGAANTDASGTWTQIERLARPAVKEATESFRNHDTTNRSTPYDDAVLAKSVKEFMIHSAGRSEAVADAAVKVLIPDEIEADLSAHGPARYLAVETNGKSGLPIPVVRLVPPNGIRGIKLALGDPYRHFGGRDPRSPAIDLSLGAIFGSLIPKLGLAPDDNRETPCLESDYTTPAEKHPLPTFPYIGDPR
ncbi:MAG: DUF4331 family protein [Candidatus Baltobacteraceae bacterium]